MRLLQYSESGELSIHSFDDGDIPPYAILSHTWGADGDEVTFADLQTGGGKTKAGYKKIIFCGDQARRDSLQYFWIDTCCIDKANKAELAFSIRSMFRWYRNATRCYVYLSDVSNQPLPVTPDHQDSRWLLWIWISSILYTMSRWYSSMMQRYFHSRHVPYTSVASDPVRSEQKAELTLKKSRWFTRGWTLQELLAPSIVEFFSKEGTKLGDKLSLAKEVCEVTGIPSSALQGELLSSFDVKERISWSDPRITTIPADRAYSLMGILGVSLSPVDGEDPAEALKRVLDEVDKQNKCLRDLRPSDQRDDKKRIEETKGGLLPGAYHWVLNNNIFRQWQQDPESRLLWIKGDPGKGKTMLLCGIIDELQNLKPKPTFFSYFFCQATDSRINSASAVLRGLLYMLVDQQPSLAVHVRKKYDRAGISLFNDANTWVALTEIFTDVLRDASLRATYLIVDALDECTTDLGKLLTFISKQSSASYRVKWIVSSRNWPDIEAQLERAGHKVKLSLELNAESVAGAVDFFIEEKVDKLAQEKKYKEELQNAVLQHLKSNANDTFLWVALVCQELEKMPRRNVLKKLGLFPPGLDDLYKRMMQHMSESDDADVCRCLLASTAVLYRPVTVNELVVLVEQLAEFVNDPESVLEVIGLCGSFLTLRDDTVYFVHQSAKDFITNASNEIFPDGVEYVHQIFFGKSLTILQKTLHRDMYKLQAPEYFIEDVRPPPNDPLAGSRYPCVYWIDHFCESKYRTPAHSATIYTFLVHQYLYWLEALSLSKSMAKGVVSMTKLWHLVQELGDIYPLNDVVWDSRRFIMYHKEVIENYPLQAYASALLFSPADSIVRKLFQHEAPREITVKPATSNGWSVCLQTLGDHRSGVVSVAFSHDSTRLASALGDTTIKIWEASSGAYLQMLRGHSNCVRLVAFSHDSTQLASASDDSTAKIWDMRSGTCVRTLKGHSNAVYSVAFSHDSTQLASASSDKTVKIWDASSGTCVRTLEGHSSNVISVAFSHDSTRLASASFDSTIKIWDASSGACVQTIEGHNSGVLSVAFSHDSTWLASASSDKTVKIWDASSGMCVHTLEGHDGVVYSVAFSHDSTRLASASSDSIVNIWDVDNGHCQQTLLGHTGDVNSVAFSHDSTRLVSASLDGTVKIWDMRSRTSVQTHEGHDGDVLSIAFSHDSTRLASASSDKTVKIWDASSGMCVHTLKGHSSYVNSVAFSHDSTRLASTSWDKTVKIWDASSGAHLQTLESHDGVISSVAFSHNSAQLASASDDRTIKIWDASNGACVQTIEGHNGGVLSVAFSHDSTRLASASSDKTVKIWDASSGMCVHTLKGHSSYVNSVAFSHDSTRLASASDDRTVKIWDASSGTCLHGFNIGIPLSHLSFDSTGALLHTEVGTITISGSQITDRIGVAASKLQYQGAGISLDCNWVVCNGRSVLWIPFEYRPLSSAVSKTQVGMGVGSGRVWLCQVDQMSSCG